MQKKNPESGFFTPRAFLAFILFFGGVLLALMAAPTPPPSRPATPSSFKPVVSKSLLNSVSPAVRDLPTGRASAPRLIEREDGLRKIRPDREVPSKFVDPVLQRVLAPEPEAPLAMPAPLATFEGLNSGEACDGCIPPDTNGAVGPSQYVQMVNASFSVYSKAGIRLAGPAQINSLFAGLPGTACANNNNGDPVVVYDRIADRWVLSQFAVPGGTVGYHECIAISKTPDATGQYFIYDFLLNPPTPEKFQDYPHFGLWPDAYYMSTHQFDPDNYIGAGAFAFERAKMLAGLPAQMVYFDLNTANPAFGGHLPANVDGPTLPPAGAPNYFAEVDTATDLPPNAALRIWKFHVDWANPANSTFGINGQPNTITPIADFVRPNCVNYSAGCVPQQGDPFQLDPIGDRLMARLVYRNFGDHESLVLNHTVVADSTTMQMGPRWYEVRNPGGTPSIFQQSTWGPSGPTDLLHRWMGSIAMDGSGDIAIGYSTSSATSFPSIAYAGRLTTDTINTLGQGEAQMFAGSGPQHGELFAPSFGRWGDYSGLTVDPTDDCTFWYTTEYYASVDEALGVWHTRIGSFKFPQCVPFVATPTPTPTATPIPTATPTPTPTPTATPTPTPSGTPQPCGTPVKYSNPGTITINDNLPASPYPSTINAFVAPGTVSKVTVELTGITHNFPDDIGALLVGPTGAKVRLMTDAGGGGTGFSLSGVTMTFDDAATLSVPDEGPIVTGSYKPTQGAINTLSNAHPASFAPPAPASPYANVLSGFNGTNPNGTWRLFVDDDTAIDGGSIQGGWSVTITTVCGGGSPTPTVTPTATPNPTATATATPAGTATATPTATGTPTATPTPGPDPDCLNAPVVVLTDPTNDQGPLPSPAPPTNPADVDIVSVSAGEDYTFINSERLVFVLKVNSNLAAIPPSQIWNVRWTFNAITYYVAMKSDDNSQVSYEYGTVAGNLITPLGGLESGSFDTQGNIRLAIAMAKVGSPTSGSLLTAVNGLTQMDLGGAVFTGEDSTSSGTYTVRAKSGACTPIPIPTTGSATYIHGGMTFSPNYTTRAPYIGQDVEPSVRCDKFGNCYVAAIRGVPGGTDLWYFDLRPTVPDPNTPGSSIPNRNYDPFMRNPQYRGQPDKITNPCMAPAPCDGTVGGDGGGDVDIAVGFNTETIEVLNAPPILAYSSLAIANISTQRSTDRGAMFIPNPGGTATGGVAGDDRQWLEFFGPNTVYIFYRTLEPAISQIQRSIDGGLTYGNATTAGAVGQAGGISVDQNDGTVYISGSNGSVSVGIPPAPGLPPITYTTHDAAGTGKAHLFFTVKVGGDGTVYVCYSDDHDVFVKFSTDKANTWSPAIRVSDGPETETAVFPWMTTGPVPGTIGVVWYGSDKLTTGDDTADWHVFYALGTDVKGNPIFRQAEASDHVIHGANISEAGLVVGGMSPNRNLADYFQVAFDPTGAAVIGYCDDHNDLSGHAFVARQISGPGATGAAIPTPVEGSSLPPPPNQPLPTAASVGGIIGSQVTDFRADVRLGGNPETGGTAVLPVDDPLDILSVLYSAEPTSAVNPAPLLVATMKVSDMTAITPSSNWRMTFAANAPNSVLSPTNEYTFGVSDRGDGFFVRATTDPTGVQTFVYGTAKRNFDGSITYTDQGAADCGFFDQTAKTITIKVALSKFNAVLPVGHAAIGAGSILTGLRGSTFTTAGSGATGNNKADTTRGGTQYTVAVGPLTPCGPAGGTPTPTATATPTSTATPTATGSPTATATPSASATATPTATATATPTGTATPTATATATSTPTATVTATPTATATTTPVVTATPTATATPVVTATPTATATATPVVTATPTATASASPTATATASASPTATATATATPTPCGTTFFSQNFDGVTAPALPPGWSTSGTGNGILWVTSTIAPDTAPNDAFIDDQNGVSDKLLISPPITIPSPSTQLRFRNNFNTEMSSGVFWDGGVLEVASPNINGGAFIEVTDPAVGGSFVSGGYTGEIDGTASNPLAGRMAWSGNSAGYITTVVNLGPNLSGQTIRLRWRMGTDLFTAAPGWRIDTLSIINGPCTTPTPTPTPTVTPTATPTPTASATPSASATPTASATATMTPVVTATPTVTATATASATASASATPTSTATATATATPAAQALNLSTRLRADTGDNAGIGGLIITGSAPKKVIIRGIGPSLTNFGFPASELLADPTLELHGPGSFVPVTNNNWRDTQEALIQATGLAPTNDLESAIIVTLPPGAYTAILRGNGPGVGVGLVEVYDLDTAAASRLGNLSTRAFVRTGSNVVIAGFILGNGAGDDRVVIRGLGPSLSGFGISNPLQDPTLELRDQNGTLLKSNNDWQDDPVQAAEITAAGLAPSDTKESAIAATLPPGLYTAILAGLTSGQGVGIVEVYDRGGGP